jgi:hypothetical protein
MKFLQLHGFIDIHDMPLFFMVPEWLSTVPSNKIVWIDVDTQSMKKVFQTEMMKLDLFTQKKHGFLRYHHLFQQFPELNPTAKSDILHGKFAANNNSKEDVLLTMNVSEWRLYFTNYNALPAYSVWKFLLSNNQFMDLYGLDVYHYQRQWRDLMGPPDPTLSKKNKGRSI